MIPLSLAQIATITGARLDRVADPGVAVTGPVVIDSRRAEPGGLFAALAGEHADGHDFAGAATAAGAVAVLATRPPGVPALIVPDVPAALGLLARAAVDRLPGMTILAVTGSSGKTTTKDLLAQVTQRLGPTVATAGSFNNELGHPLTVLRADTRTRYLVLELGARGRGHIARLCEIAPPRLGAVLNVGRAHVGGYFADRAEVAQAKGELVEALPGDGVAVLNADDPAVAAMASRTAARVVTFGLDGTATVRATGVVLDEQARPAFTLVTPEGAAPVRLNLRGAHNVPNALAVAALARGLGMDTAGTAGALCAAEARSRWRMEVTRRADGVTVINDAYNANPESMSSALAALRSIARGGRAFAVLGHMAELGKNAEEWHEEIGALAARTGVAALIVVGDEAAPMLAGAKSEAGWRGELLHVPDGRAAMRALAPRLGPDDVVLVKASRAAGLEQVALALLEPPGGEGDQAGAARRDEAAQ
ncbi:MAG: UDP-N-acetylmuramoyl-tripeptide--D-alanyl-D-alanine ligase [Micromonosporaceae bacterium]